MLCITAWTGERQASLLRFFSDASICFLCRNCPGYNEVLGTQLGAYHGQLTAETAIRYVIPITQTGDLHVYVADLVNEVPV